MKNYDMRNDRFEKVWNFGHLIFGFVSNFGIRISYFLFIGEKNKPFGYWITF